MEILIFGMSESPSGSELFGIIFFVVLSQILGWLVLYSLL